MTGPEPSTSPPPPGNDAAWSMVATIAAAIEDAIRLFFQHVALARAEIAEGIGNMSLAGALSAGAGFVALLAIMFLLVGAALALALIVPAWAAFTLVGALLLAAGAILALLARQRFARAKLVPRRSLASLRENASRLRDILP
jgi:Putative Actinobacterial Holin-X, holin superfamily III